MARPDLAQPFLLLTTVAVGLVLAVAGAAPAVGRIVDLDYSVDAGEDAVADLVSRVYGTGGDSIRIRERVDLNGASSRAIVKSQVALRDDATAEIVGASRGIAARARGHVDCMGIVRDRAAARSVPDVSVTHPLAKVTNEAAIGALDKRQIRTLLARGVAPDEPVDIVVREMLW